MEFIIAPVYTTCMGVCAGGEENLFQPVNGQSALEYAGLNGAESIGQSLSGIQRNIFEILKVERLLGISVEWRSDDLCSDKVSFL